MSQSQWMHRDRIEAQQEFRWMRHYDQLEWQYGYDRADAIVAGKDEATRLDLVRWRSLGISPRSQVAPLTLGAAKQCNVPKVFAPGNRK